MLHGGRTDFLGWPEYFMGIALLSAQRSKDPNTQVGACIVNSKNRIVGIGYNGFPTGCLDCHLPWERTAESPLDTKYPYVIHAEQNAIINSSKELEGCILYVTLFPCNDCAKVIIQNGIKEVIYLNDHTDPVHDISVAATKRLFSIYEIKYRKFTSSKEGATLKFSK